MCVCVCVCVREEKKSLYPDCALVIQGLTRLHTETGTTITVFDVSDNLHG